MEDFLKEVSEACSFRRVGEHWAAGAACQAEPVVPQTHLCCGHRMGLDILGLLLLSISQLCFVPGAK